MRAVCIGFAALLVGCSPPDVCQGVSGACVSLHVEGSGDVDQLQVQFSGVVETPAKTTPNPPKRKSLPIDVAAAISQAADGMESVHVVGWLQGKAISEGASPFVLSASRHVAVTVVLNEGVADLAGSADDMPVGDAAVGDGAVGQYTRLVAGQFKSAGYSDDQSTLYAVEDDSAQTQVLYNPNSGSLIATLGSGNLLASAGPVFAWSVQTSTDGPPVNRLNAWHNGKIQVLTENYTPFDFGVVYDSDGASLFFEQNANYANQTAEDVYAALPPGGGDFAITSLGVMGAPTVQFAPVTNVAYALVPNLSDATQFDLLRVPAGSMTPTGSRVASRCNGFALSDDGARVAVSCNLGTTGAQPFELFEDSTTSLSLADTAYSTQTNVLTYRSGTHSLIHFEPVADGGTPNGVEAEAHEYFGGGGGDEYLATVPSYVFTYFATPFNIGFVSNIDANGGVNLSILAAGQTQPIVFDGAGQLYQVGPAGYFSWLRQLDPNDQSTWSYRLGAPDGTRALTLPSGQINNLQIDAAHVLTIDGNQNLQSIDLATGMPTTLRPGVKAFSVFPNSHKLVFVQNNGRADDGIYTGILP